MSREWVVNGGGNPSFDFYFGKLTLLESAFDFSILLLGSMVWLWDIKTVLTQNSVGRACSEPAE